MKVLIYTHSTNTGCFQCFKFDLHKQTHPHSTIMIYLHCVFTWESLRTISVKRMNDTRQKNVAVLQPVFVNQSFNFNLIKMITVFTGIFSLVCIVKFDCHESGKPKSIQYSISPSLNSHMYVFKFKFSGNGKQENSNVSDIFACGFLYKNFWKCWPRHFIWIGFLSCVFVCIFSNYALDVYDYNCVFVYLFRVESIENVEPQPPHWHGFYPVIFKQNAEWQFTCIWFLTSNC